MPWSYDQVIASLQLSCWWGVLVMFHAFPGRENSYIMPL